MLIDLVLQTLRSVRAHALRFALTSLGMAWGIMMLTYLSASMDGYDAHFARQVDQIGQRIVFLFPGTVTKQRLGQRGTRSVELKREDVTRLGELHQVEHAGANTWVGPRIFRAGSRTKLVFTHGVTEDTATIRNFEVGQGRFISRREVDTAASVVFLGAKTARRLFGAAPAVDRTVHVDGIPFRVVGVSREKGEQLLYIGPADDEVALIPVTTAAAWFTHTRVVGQVVFAPRTRPESWAALDSARALLGLHRRFDAGDKTAMGSFNVQEIVQIIDLLLLGLRVFLSSATLITLLVGAVGVMNIMLVVVSERTKEIGLRKAIGASNREIFVQFLLETLAVTLIAGLAGATLGVLGVQASAAVIGPGNTMQAVPVLRPVVLVYVFATLVGTGLAAGTLPALRAMRIDPAESLRAI